MAEVRRWVDTISQCDKHTELDAISANASSLLLFRTERDGGSGASLAADLATETLRAIASSDSPHSDIYWDQYAICHRCLLLSGRWEEVDRFADLFSAAGQYRWLLFQADANLAKARQVLGLAPWDDEWDLKDSIPDIRPKDPHLATTLLDKASSLLTQGRPLAETEDRRLECTRQTDKLTAKAKQILKLQTWIRKGGQEGSRL